MDKLVAVTLHNPELGACGITILAARDTTEAKETVLAAYQKLFASSGAAERLTVENFTAIEIGHGNQQVNSLAVTASNPTFKPVDIY